MPLASLSTERNASQTEGETLGTFALNYINATIVYQYYLFSLKMAQQGRNM
jgi:hypothetical protein